MSSLSARVLGAALLGETPGEVTAVTLAEEVAAETLVGEVAAEALDTLDSLEFVVILPDCAAETLEGLAELLDVGLVTGLNVFLDAVELLGDFSEVLDRVLSGSSFCSFPDESLLGGRPREN
eukprot:gnl/TRDRNA2_/TRDRNA2_176776_c0_seq9.p2 gnl/TRDRNA2_/TRDRNA2_176776_c0~~gnl/TRDRNA2_/TRDRNA2_176776_c0_seq9.p2  ORF type:complete len:122 (+),score=16.47 gnl/TRDRNA2_/TRDRNA2_176776_c0_seq9:49-414(+)